jgi:hypothetical protein
VFQPAAQLHVRVTPSCSTPLHSSMSELLLRVPARCPALCQSYCLVCQHNSVLFFQGYCCLLFQHTALFPIRVAPHSSSTLLCSVSELLTSVAAHYCVPCKIYSIVFHHTALFCIRYILTIHHKV